jgi:hypothetical protein
LKFECRTSGREVSFVKVALEEGRVFPYISAECVHLQSYGRLHILINSVADKRGDKFLKLYERKICSFNGDDYGECRFLGYYSVWLL